MKQNDNNSKPQTVTISLFFKNKNKNERPTPEKIIKNILSETLNEDLIFKNVKEFKVKKVGCIEMIVTLKNKNKEYKKIFPVVIEKLWKEKISCCIEYN